MEKIIGIVTAISDKKGKYGIALGTGNWFNGFGKPPCNKGDEVEITYEINGQFKNIEQVYVNKKVESIKLKEEYHLSIEECRARALECVIANKTAPEEFSKLLEIYFNWIYEGKK